MTSHFQQGVEEVTALAKLQQEDDSLVELRRKETEQKDGYNMLNKNGVLVQTKFIVPGREVRRMVVPIPRRRDLRNSPQRLNWWTLLP